MATSKPKDPVVKTSAKPRGSRTGIPKKTATTATTATKKTKSPSWPYGQPKGGLNKTQKKIRKIGKKVRKAVKKSSAKGWGSRRGS